MKKKKKKTHDFHKLRKNILQIFIFLNLEMKYKSSNIRLFFNCYFLKLLPSLLFKHLGINNEKSEHMCVPLMAFP